MQAEMITIIRQAEHLEETLTRDLNKYMMHKDPSISAFYVRMIDVRNRLRVASESYTDAIKALE